MRLSHRTRISACVIATAFGVGCVTPATIPLAPLESSEEANRFEVAPGRANIYIARSGEFKGSAIAFAVTLDGDAIGRIAPSTFYVVSVERGMHSVEVSAVENSDRVDFMAEAGRNHFLEVSAKLGASSARVDLLPVRDRRGLELVQRARLGLLSRERTAGGDWDSQVEAHEHRDAAVDEERKRRQKRK